MIVRVIPARVTIQSGAIEKFGLIDEKHRALVRCACAWLEFPHGHVENAPAERYPQAPDHPGRRSVPGPRVPRNHCSYGVPQTSQRRRQRLQHIGEPAASCPRARFRRNHQNSGRG